MHQHILVTLASLCYGYAAGWDRFLTYRKNPFQGRTVEQRLLHSLTKRGRKVAAATPEAVTGVDLVTLPDGQVLDAIVSISLPATMIRGSPRCATR
jgi:hypothetical protein